MLSTTKHVLKGVSLTVLSALFAVVGLIIASTENIVFGVLIVVGCSVFWGYSCLLSSITEENKKAILNYNRYLHM